MIFVKSNKIIEALDDLRPKATMQGFYKFEGVKPDGRKRVIADWFPNLILNQGLNRIGSGGAFDRCRVGSGTATPAITDTALQAEVGFTTLIQSQSNTTVATPTYHSRIVRTFRFNPGVADGNLSEVGVGSASILFSRARILDALSNPTTITVLPDEYLDVTYELRFYSPTADLSQTISISGTNYDVTLRAAEVDAAQWSGSQILSAGSTAPLTVVTAYTGAIGALTGSPSGTSASGATYFNPPTYVADSFQRTFSFQMGLNQGNLAGGIRSLYIHQGALGAFQAQFTPNIPKDSTRTLTMPLTIAWARYTP